MIDNTEENEETENIYELVEEKIHFGENLIRYIDENKAIDGLQKLSRKINQELKFLKKVQHFYPILYCTNI